jgi:hypothetical protein
LTTDDTQDLKNAIVKLKEAAKSGNIETFKIAKLEADTIIANSSVNQGKGAA